MKRRKKIGCSVIGAAVALIAGVLLLRELVTEGTHRIHRFRPSDGIAVDVYHGDFADPTFNFYWSVISQGDAILSRQVFFMTHDAPTQRFNIVTSPDSRLVALAGVDQPVLYAICDLTTGRKWTSADLDSGQEFLARVNQGRGETYSLASSFPWKR